MPFGVFSTSSSPARCGVAIGDNVLDLTVLHQAGLLSGLNFDASVLLQSTLNAFMELPRPCWQATRARLTALLAIDSEDRRLRDNEALRSLALVKMSDVKMHLPATIGDYTDFYSSREHATNVGIMFRGKDNALQPNWLHLPVGYHGRASSVVISGTDVVRPSGQLQKNKENPKEGSTYGPCRLLDFELEMAFFVGGPENPLGNPISMENAEDRIFGMVLMNDWSARDIQAWEYVPLGPFTAKNFATTISPWIVTLDALEAFRCSSSAGPTQSDPNPTPLPYITDPNYATGAYDIKLDVAIKPADENEKSSITHSNFRNMYWNMKQQLVHHAVTGCTMRAGDLLGSGTISGQDESAYGSMLELSWRGAKEISLVNSPSKQVRKFLKDGDDVIMTGYAEAADGSYRVGFGECSGKVLAAGTKMAAQIDKSAKGYSNFKLYAYWRSTSSWRVRLALNLKSIPHDIVAINLAPLVGNTDQQLPDDYRSEVNQLGQVPTLEFTEVSTGKVHRLTQSMAIIEFLDEIFPSVPLQPADPLAKAAVKQMAEIVNSGIQPMQNLSVLRQVKDAVLLGPDEVHTDGKGFGKSKIEQGLAVLEQLVLTAGGGSNGRFAGGTEYPTIADLCIIPQLYNAGRFGVDMSKYPSLVAVGQTAANHPAFVASSPEAQPDAQV